MFFNSNTIIFAQNTFVKVLKTINMPLNNAKYDTLLSQFIGWVRLMVFGGLLGIFTINAFNVLPESKVHLAEMTDQGETMELEDVDDFEVLAFDLKMYDGYAIPVVQLIYKSPIHLLSQFITEPCSPPPDLG